MSRVGYLPDETIATDTQTFESNRNDYQRPEAVRLILPGVDEQQHRLSHTEHIPLADICKRALDSRRIEQVELLFFPGDHFLETIFTPKIDKSVSPPDQNSRNANLSDFAGDEPPDGTSYNLTNLGDIVVDELSEAIGVHRCAVDFGPLGTSPPITTRVLLKENRELTGTLRKKAKTIATILRKLYDAQEPCIVQVLLQKHSQYKYRVSVRHCVFVPEHIVSRTAEKIDIIKNGPLFDFSGDWHKLGLRTNRDLDIRDYWTINFGSLRIRQANYRELSDSRRALLAYFGFDEFVELLQGRPGTIDIIGKDKYYGKITIPQPNLSDFATYTPRYYQTDVWQTVPGRNKPIIRVQEALRQAAGTDHTFSAEYVQGTKRTRSPSPTAGKEGHGALENTTAEIYTQKGFDVEMVTQDGESVPDLKARNDALELWIEAEDEGKTKPAGIPTNYERAAMANVPVVFVVYQNNSDSGKVNAEQIWNKLQQPYKKTKHDVVSETAVHLYNGKSPPPTDEDLYLPDTTREAIWQLTHDGTLQLVSDDGDILASGPASDSVASFDFKTPRYRQDGNAHQIVSHDGHVLDEASTERGVTDTWTELYKPHVPIDLFYCTDMMIQEVADDRLIEYDLLPESVSNASGKRDFYRKSLRAFIRNHLVEVPGADFPQEKIRDAYNDWFEGITAAGLESGDLTPPGIKEFARAIPDHIDRKQLGHAGSDGRAWKNYKLKYPRGIVSPDLPFVDEDDDE